MEDVMPTLRRRLIALEKIAAHFRQHENQQNRQQDRCDRVGMPTGCVLFFRGVGWGFRIAVSGACRCGGIIRTESGRR